MYNIIRVLRFSLYYTRECRALVLDREEIRVYIIKEERVLLNNSTSLDIIIKVSRALKLDSIPSYSSA
jgi:hypothetical protein